MGRCKLLKSGCLISSESTTKIEIHVFRFYIEQPLEYVVHIALEASTCSFVSCGRALIASFVEGKIKVNN